MSDYDQQKRQQAHYTESNNLEAHIIADMLRIESITTEVREFKQDTKLRLNKIENWLVAIVGTTFTTLVAILVGLLINFFGGI
jgi:hypothetical protein